MFSKIKLAMSPLLSSAIGGATVAAFTMLGAEKRLMQASFAAFLYYFVQISASFRISPGRFVFYRVAFIAATPLFYIGVERIPIVIEFYRILVQNSAFLFCICEAISIMYLSLQLSERINQSVWASEISDEANWTKYSVLGVVVAAYSICAWFWTALLWTGLPLLSEGLVYYISLINIPIVTAISIIDEHGSIVDGAIGSVLITYCAWASESVATLNFSALASIIFGSGSFDWRPFISVVVGFIAILVAIAVFLDTDTSLSDSDASRYLLEIEPFIKACLVLLGTNLLCTMADYHSYRWYRFRLAEACIIPLAYWFLLSGNQDDSI